MTEDTAVLLYRALKQLLHEVLEAGFDNAPDYNWPKAIADAREAVGKAESDDSPRAVRSTARPR